MESPDSSTTPIGGTYPEEILLEAYNLEWESIELRRQRLRKTWQQFLLMEKMEQEERHYQRQMQRFKQQEQEKQAREQAKREQAEAQQRQREKAAPLVREKERAEVKKQKKVKQVAVSGTQTDEEPVQSKMKKTKTSKPKGLKSKTQPKQSQQVKPVIPKRITPVSLPSAQPEDDESVTENQMDHGGYDSPPPELLDDGLLNMLSLDKDSDSDDDDEPSMVSLILPVPQESPKRVQPIPLKRKKRHVSKNEGPALDFNFSNAEARRKAKFANAAAQEQEDNDEVDSEPEPMPTPKKHLNRRKKANGVSASGGKSLMTHMANTTIAVKSKRSAINSATEAGNNAVQKRILGNNANKEPQTKTKTQPKNAKANPENEENSIALSTKKKVGGKGETMSIKQRLANAELLSRMNKMQDMSTPKVLDKKTKKTHNQGAAKTLAAKRAEFRKVLANDATEPDVPQRDQLIEEGDLNISLNSSGLMSDNDSPENLRAPTRKRPRGTADGDVTPTKKLQFLEITKRLVKSPMPRFLRTPTPLMSPVVASGLTKPKALSPAPRAVSAHSTATTRRLNSAPVRPRKTNANRFGVPVGGANTAANSGGFSMFDAFVNSGSSGAIPRLKTNTRGDVSPSV